MHSIDPINSRRGNRSILLSYYLYHTMCIQLQKLHIILILLLVNPVDSLFQG